MEHRPQQNALGRNVIVLATASSGYGHVQAAQNVGAALNETSGPFSIVFVNVYDFLDTGYRLLFESGWKTVSLTPGLSDAYRALHHQIVSNSYLARAVENRVRQSADRLLACMQKLRIVHFIAFHPAAVLVGIHIKKLANCELTVVATDFVLHSMQCHTLVDRYFAPPKLQYISPYAQRIINADNLHLTGIPLAADFRRSDATAIFAGGESKDFKVIVSFGGSGYRGLENLPLIAEIIELSHPCIRFLIVTGFNSHFRAAAIERLRPFISSGRIEVQGFIPHLASLMASSHVLIGKAGGLTLSEAFSVGLPVIVVDALPGQEDYNASFVCDQALGLRSRDAKRIVRFVELLRQRRYWEEARARAIAWGRPDSSARIAHILTTGQSIAGAVAEHR